MSTFKSILESSRFPLLVEVEHSKMEDLETRLKNANASYIKFPKYFIIINHGDSQDEVMDAVVGVTTSVDYINVLINSLNLMAPDLDDNDLDDLIQITLGEGDRSIARILSWMNKNLKTSKEDQVLAIDEDGFLDAEEGEVSADTFDLCYSIIYYFGKLLGQKENEEAGQHRIYRISNFRIGLCVSRFPDKETDPVGDRTNRSIFISISSISPK